VAEFSGASAVRSFFDRIIKRLDMTAFEPAQYIVQDDTVVVTGSEAGTVRATGQPFRNEWVQRYEVHDGLITAMTEYNIQVEPKS
jgi:ketosteroid isomerase-like protein